MLTRKRFGKFSASNFSATAGLNDSLTSACARVFLHAQASSHEPHQINWGEFVNRADGISKIEGKAARVAVSEQGGERVSNSPATPKQAKAGVSKAPRKKDTNCTNSHEFRRTSTTLK